MAALVAGHELSLDMESRGYSLVEVHRPLIVVASLVGEHRLESSGFSTCLVAPWLKGSSQTRN